LNALNLLVLRCRDLEAARAFYESFGLRFTKHAHGSGPEHYAHEDPRGVFELYPATGPTDDKTGLGFGFPDVESMHHRLTAAGHAPQPIRQNPWGKTFVVRDPDDRRVEVKELTA